MNLGARPRAHNHKREVITKYQTHNQGWLPNTTISIIPDGHAVKQVSGGPTPPTALPPNSPVPALSYLNFPTLTLSLQSPVYCEQDCWRTRGLVEAADGTVFGATRSTAFGPLPYPLGGWPIGSGVLYQIDATGNMQTQPLPVALTEPMPSTGTEGRVIVASDGRLYGSQWLGGNAYPDQPMGCGGIFWSRTPVE